MKEKVKLYKLELKVHDPKYREYNIQEWFLGENTLKNEIREVESVNRAFFEEEFKRRNLPIPGYDTYIYTVTVEVDPENLVEIGRNLKWLNKKSRS